MQAMATCHSLVSIEGEIVGDPLDIAMFSSIGWVSKFFFYYIFLQFLLVLILASNVLDT